MKAKRGPVLCDLCGLPALAPWAWFGNVVCPNCLLRRVSDAIREGIGFAAEPYSTRRSARPEKAKAAPKVAAPPPVPAEKVLRIVAGRKR